MADRDHATLPLLVLLWLLGCDTRSGVWPVGVDQACDSGGGEGDCPTPLECTNEGISDTTGWTCQLPCVADADCPAEADRQSVRCLDGLCDRGPEQLPR